MRSEAKVRLYVEQPLGPGQAVALGEAAANYLFNVMRLTPGAEVALFNDSDGEWLARVVEAGKRQGILRAERLTRPRLPPADLWLVFAPLKKARLDMVVEKGVEMGAARLIPVRTRYTNAERLRPEKLRAHMIEAAEQCELTCLPELAELQPLETLLAAWPADRRLYWADEGLAGQQAFLQAERGTPAAMLIGPEGGFSPEERELLASRPFVTPFALGPRILRADTAAVAALALWQSTAGDWA